MMTERKILKAYLLSSLFKLFNRLFLDRLSEAHSDPILGCYLMDSKIIQLLIQGIINSGEYTMEGIACHTRIPFDVIYDAACGNNKQFSIVPWAKIVDLYMQVKPEIAELLYEMLLEIKNQQTSSLSLLLNET